MKFSARISASAALLLVLASTVGCTKLKARDQLVKGVAAFKGGRYEEAVNHFQTSIELDPNYPTARLYLATAYSYQVVPNLDSPDNLKIAQKAMDGFNAVLADNPNDLGALRQIASIHRNIKQSIRPRRTSSRSSRLIPPMQKPTTPSASSTGPRLTRTPSPSSAKPTCRTMATATSRSPRTLARSSSPLTQPWWKKASSICSRP